tara:strand:- start:7777 stop:8208 length:432 start_codon:yes stop_codon:yes gene_type:complete
LPVWLESKVDPIELLVRLIVGGIFIFAGYNKLIDLQAFELAVRNYSIFNDPWVAVLVMILPPFELLVGLLIVLRTLYMGSLVLVTTLTLTFIFALCSLLVRDINIECGCLGLSNSIELQILIDITILGACVYLFKSFRKTAEN